MAIAFGNNIGGYDDISYLPVNGKTVRQIILGEGKPKKELRLQDNSKYLYLGADRATNKWTPFCFEEYQPQLLSGFLAANVIPRFDKDYTKELRITGVRGYSYRYKGFQMLPDTASIRLFGLVTNTSPYTDYIVVDSTNSKITLSILDSVTNTGEETIWTSETSLQSATFSINLYATDSYLYKNTSAKPRLYADIILDYPPSSDYPEGIQYNKHVVYTSRSVLGEFGGNCPFLAKFFSERQKLVDCKISSTLPNLTSSQTSIVNYFVNA